MFIKVVLGILLIAVASGNALKCYHCLGSLTSDCQQGISASVVRDCSALIVPDSTNIDNTPHVANCIEATLTEGYENPYVMRFCAFSADPCDKIDQKLISCRSCDSDQCNYQPVSNNTVV